MNTATKKTVDELMQSFPAAQMPISGETMGHILRVCAENLQTRYVAKSERMQALEEELAAARQMYSEATRVAEIWKDKSPASMPLPDKKTYKYVEADPEWANAAAKRITEEAAVMRNYIGNCRRSIEAMQNTFASAVQELNRALEIESKGCEGEARVEDFLVRSLDCRVLSNVILPSAWDNENGPKTAETDLLIFTDHGIYVCEVKNYGKMGQTLEVQVDGRFFKLDYNGSVLEDMGSPVSQNYRHCQAVRKILADAGLGGITVYPAVIIANTEVDISNYSHYWVGDMYAFRDMIFEDYHEARFTPAQMQAAYAAVQNKRMTERSFPIAAVSPIAEKAKWAITWLSWAAETHNNWCWTMTNTVKQWLDNSHSEWVEANKKRIRVIDFLTGLSNGYLIAYLIGLVTIPFIWFSDNATYGGEAWLMYILVILLRIVLDAFFWNTNNNRIVKQKKCSSLLVATLRCIPWFVFLMVFPLIAVLLTNFFACVR